MVLLLPVLVLGLWQAHTATQLACKVIQATVHYEIYITLKDLETCFAPKLLPFPVSRLVVKEVVRIIE